jgi:hypothetical protein
MNTIARTSSPKYPNLAAVPPSYRALCEEWLPRPIHDAATNEEATSMIDALAGFSLNREQEDYLEAVSHFVSDYEGDYLPQVSGRYGLVGDSRRLPPPWRDDPARGAADHRRSCPQPRSALRG